MYPFKEIETKWQKKWQEAKIFEVKEKPGKKKFYCLEMFPYPSGSGLHMGHAFNYIIGDIYARFKRMNGFNVLYPMGYDSLGLPAENAAILVGTHPKEYTENSIKNFIRQQKELGLSYDWSRMIKTHDPDFYQWDQWIFLKMFEKGLAFRKKAPVNFCPKCQTVLANEQVHNGKCWRHQDTGVEIKHLEQWFFRITHYVEELYDNIDKLTGWPEEVKTMQKNWIGKSYGTEINFEINQEKWPVFTTRPDTLFGVTFMVISSQHPRLKELVTKEQEKEINLLLKKIKSTSEKDLELEKEGAFTGSYALHPFTKEKIPIYAGNFVLAEYGSGMVMAVPAHDQRDFEFAKKYHIPIKVVIQPKKEIKAEEISEAYLGEGVLVNSGEFSGLSSKEGKEKISDYLEKNNLGRRVTNYKLRDWLVSRQRYWGVPIPIIYCPSCGIIPVPEKDLPVKLPEKVEFGKGNPLATNEEFVNVQCPQCRGKARRETDTMDTFVNSSWYFLRYCDPCNNKKIFNKKKVAYWLPVDLYIGGKEHACMHLIYFRFYTKFLRDLGLLNFDEPALNLFNQGMLHKEGVIMSKSKGNIVLPEEVSHRYGIDTARLFLVSLASPDKDIEWSDEGINGSLRFINRVINFLDNFQEKKISKTNLSRFNRLIKDYTAEIDYIKYNLAVIKLKEIFSILEKGCNKKSLEVFIKLISPICPHLAEEFWEKLGHRSFISLEKWPKAGEKKIDLKGEGMEDAVIKAIKDIENILQLTKLEKPKRIILFIAEGWKYYLFSQLRKLIKENHQPDQLIKSLMQTELKSYGQEIIKIVPKLVADPNKIPPFDLDQETELKAFKRNKKLIRSEFKCPVKIIRAEESKEPKAKQALPLKPGIIVL